MYSFFYKIPDGPERMQPNNPQGTPDARLAQEIAWRINKVASRRDGRGGLKVYARKVTISEEREIQTMERRHNMGGNPGDVFVEAVSVKAGFVRI